MFQRVFLIDNQRKVKFQYNGKLGRSVDFMLHPLGSQAITVTNIQVEVCAEPISGKMATIFL